MMPLQLDPARTRSMYLGPATVVSVSEEELIVASPEGTVRAELALAFPYAPVRGDIVLLFGETEHYVIGVLRAAGKTRFVVPGDMEIRAGGKLELVAGESADVRAPRVNVRADRFEVVAQAAFERFLRCYRWAKDLFSLSAGRTRTLVEGEATLHADRIVEKAQKNVHIDGEQINLG
jgi:hypothetical protein